jgi:hypothetical protein
MRMELPAARSSSDNDDWGIRKIPYRDRPQEARLAKTAAIDVLSYLTYLPLPLSIS